MKSIFTGVFGRDRGLEPDRCEGILQLLQLGVGTGDDDVRHPRLIQWLAVQVREQDWRQIRDPQADRERHIVDDPDLSNWRPAVVRPPTEAVARVSGVRGEADPEHMDPRPRHTKNCHPVGARRSSRPAIERDHDARRGGHRLHRDGEGSDHERGARRHLHGEARTCVICRRDLMAAWSDKSLEPEVCTALQVGAPNETLDTVYEEVEVGVRLREAPDDKGRVGIDLVAGLDH